MLDVRLYMAQRFSALIMAPFVLIHLGVIVYAVRGGLSAGEILSRTQGSLFWALFYGGFVMVASVHGAIGLRVIAHEWLGLGGRALDVLMWLAGGLLVWLGMRAVLAVMTGGGP